MALFEKYYFALGDFLFLLLGVGVFLFVDIPGVFVGYSGILGDMQGYAGNICFVFLEGFNFLKNISVYIRVIFDLYF